MSDLIGCCPNCQTAIPRDHPYAWCIECGKPLPAAMQAELGVVPARNDPAEPVRSNVPRVEFRRFDSYVASWDEMFAQVGAFATRVGRERLISISHSEDKNNGVVTVWYWTA